MTEPQPVPVVATISGKDLLDKFDSLTASVNQLATKLDDVPSKVADHESRIRALERKVFLATGGAGVLGAIVGYAVQLIGAHTG